MVIGIEQNQDHNILTQEMWDDRNPQSWEYANFPSTGPNAAQETRAIALKFKAEGRLRPKEPTDKLAEAEGGR